MNLKKQYILRLTKRKDTMSSRCATKVVARDKAVSSGSQVPNLASLTGNPIAVIILVNIASINNLQELLSLIGSKEPVLRTRRIHTQCWWQVHVFSRATYKKQHNSRPVIHLINSIIPIIMYKFRTTSLPMRCI